MFKNEAIAKNSPFRVGRLRTVADAEEITFDWVGWHNDERLRSHSGNIPPEEHERNYYAQRNGPLTGDAADKTAARKPRRSTFP